MADQSNRYLEPWGRAADRTQSRVMLVGWLVSMLLVAFVAVFATRQFAGGEKQAPASPASDRRTASRSPASDPAPFGNDNRVPDDPRETDAVTAGNRSSEPGEMASLTLSDVPQSGPDSPDDQAAGNPSSETLMQWATAAGLVPIPSVVANTPPIDTVAQWCRQIASVVDGMARKDCMSAAYRDSGHRSVEGRPLVVRHIPASSRPAMGRVLLIGATHGDEPTSIGTTVRWVQLLADEGTPYNWRVMPVLNPDGALHVPATRVNANGVDLNRNLPTTGWEEKSRAYWQRVGFEQRRFPGESAGSEPENRWLAKEIAEFKPDVIITLHAPYGVLDYDGDFPPPRKLGHLDLHRLGVYPGSLGNFASRMQGIPVITIELDDAHELPAANEIESMWADLNGWLDRYLRSVRQAQVDTPDGAG